MNDINLEASKIIADLPQKQRINPDDWQGNNAAFFCPLCKRAFLVSYAKNIHNQVRTCPRCTGAVKCVGICTGSANQGGHAFAYFVSSSEK